MKKIKYPDKKEWGEILKRPVLNTGGLEKTVNTILQDVKQNGDEAIRKYTLQFDGVNLNEFLVSEKEIASAETSLSAELKKAIVTAKNNIEKFHASQKEEIKKVETTPGVICWRKSIGIEKVGLYIPGGTAPLFSTVLMLGVPAQIAGCKEIILCTPSNKNGEVNPAILFAANLVGIKTIYKIGGVQAIAAMAYGTETISKAYKIFGPGNSYVTCAKQLVSNDVAIDMPAGPSEVAVLADETCIPEFVAADLLSQAEHGVDSQAVLVSNSNEVIENILNEVLKQLEQLPRKDIASKALENSMAILVKDLDEGIDLLNQYASEHLILACKNYEEFSFKIINAGSVFLGNYSCESAGDYASGTNHTLPTYGNAKAYSGVSLDSFVKKVTFQQLSKEGINNLGKTIELMAEAEGLLAHKNAVSLRTKYFAPLRETNTKDEFELKNILRSKIKELIPYSSARDEFKGREGVFLDANENSFGSPLDENYNRYPDPLQLKLKEKISKLKNIPTKNIFLGNGSDEAIDILFRAFCNPGKDNVIVCPPTYGMYEVSANINDAEVIKVPLMAETFQLDINSILKAINPNTKLIFVCCPNNPTGNGVKWNDIKTILEKFDGVVVADEAYIDFASYKSLLGELNNYPNLVVLQTLSKAWGMAGLRVGMAFASEEIIKIYNKIKPPYNMNSVSQQLAIEALENSKQIKEWIETILSEREKLNDELMKLPFVLKVYPSEANFILVKTTNPKNIYNYLVQNQIIIRDRSKVELCEGCLRITIGTKEENKKLIDILKQYQ